MIVIQGADAENQQVARTEKTAVDVNLEKKTAHGVQFPKNKSVPFFLVPQGCEEKSGTYVKLII
jgi:hypothetical protein